MLFCTTGLCSTVCPQPRLPVAAACNGYAIGAHDYSLTRGDAVISNSRNLIVCCDGTWNTAEQKDRGVPIPTNVVRIYNAVADADANSVEQIKYYHPGVGTGHSLLDKTLGGSFGLGLDQNIMGAYKWLGENYTSGDNIYLFGFSRGAYTVRSLAGMISKCGLLDLSDPNMGDKEQWGRVDVAFKEGYRYHGKKDKQRWAQSWPFHTDDNHEDVGIFFLGVWDTVGAMGVPRNLAILSLLDDPKKYDFHDTNLSEKVAHARHAVALDEMRASFTPTLWGNATTHPDAQELWFPGVHCDVGGGYAETGLSDGALKWMMDEAERYGLVFNDNITNGQINPDYKGVLHDSVTSIFKLMRTQPRSIPLLNDTSYFIHDSAKQRKDAPPITQAPYWPTTILTSGQKSRPLSIYASKHWNATGIYLQAGTYIATATGEWLDWDMKFSADGKLQNISPMGQLVHLTLNIEGTAEEFYKHLMGNQSADFKGTKRLEQVNGVDCPWFALVGVVANGGNPDASGTPAPHEIIPLWQGCCRPNGHRFTINAGKEGYLYCFANDAWDFYEHNKGSVQLTVMKE